MDSAIPNQQQSTPQQQIPPIRNYDKKVHGKRYSPARKLAVRALAETGMSFTEIAKQEGMSRPNVYSVMKDQKISLLAKQQVDAIKNSLVGMTYANAHRAQDAITDEKLANSSALQLMTVSAIGIEKGRLMENLSTDNVSFRGVSQSIDEDRAKIMARFSEVLDDRT
jgi:hypothetical protein